MAVHDFHSRTAKMCFCASPGAPQGRGNYGGGGRGFAGRGGYDYGTGGRGGRGGGFGNGSQGYGSAHDARKPLHALLMTHASVHVHVMTHAAHACKGQWFRCAVNY